MIVINDLTVAYPDGTKAIDGLSLTIDAGERVAVAGANGAGKTTLMLAIVGVLPAVNGFITVDGTAVKKDTLGEIRARAGLLFQNPDDQLFMPTVYDDVAFGPRNRGMREDEVRRVVDETLSRLGAAHLKDRSSLKLSGGEKRIAAIAAVLATRPSALLFDEPTAFLDIKARRNLIGTINGLHQTKLIASHDLSFLLETCTTAVLLKDGKVYAKGSAHELLNDEQTMLGCDLEPAAYVAAKGGRNG